MGKVYPVALALDGVEEEQGLELVRAIGSRISVVKLNDALIGFPDGCVQRLKEAGARRVWGDIKAFDVPRTVERWAKRLKAMGGDILTVHAQSMNSMRAALEADLEMVLGVTVLTSMSPAEVEEEYGGSPAVVTLRRARKAMMAGLHGVICSPLEVGMLADKKEYPELGDMTLFTPGVRSPGVDAEDQERVDTPLAAFTAGSRMTVHGSEFVKAADPVAALERIASDCSETWTKRGLITAESGS